MQVKRLITASLIFICAGLLLSVNAGALDKITVTTQISGNVSALQTLPEVITEVKAPTLTNPSWLQAQIDAERASINSSSKTHVTYSVATRGAVTANLDEFKSLANQTLNDSRGWSRMGVSFQEVARGGNFILVLSEASQMSTFSSGCTADWSCTVSPYVIINQDRWQGASYAWNQSGGSLRDYRNMVINHETGHWLGHGHLYSCGPGGSAPVMMQQSISLNGCTFNPWPLSSELWSSTLGIG